MSYILLIITYDVVLEAGGLRLKNAYMLTLLFMRSSRLGHLPSLGPSQERHTLKRFTVVTPSSLKKGHCGEKTKTGMTHFDTRSFFAAVRQTKTS
jgi:hypothetical protein